MNFSVLSLHMAIVRHGWRSLTCSCHRESRRTKSMLNAEWDGLLLVPRIMLYVKDLRLDSTQQLGPSFQLSADDKSIKRSSNQLLSRPSKHKSATSLAA